jgi:4-amino-4-deoxy-L-arabinose transferase-like glycosyltransferase
LSNVEEARILWLTERVLNLGKNTKGQIYILLLTIILLAFALRAYRLGAQALWDDEAFAVLLARQDFYTVLARTLGDTFPPIFNFSLHFWMKLAGDVEFVVRFLPMICGVLLVPVIYQTGKVLAGTRAGLLATLLVAFSPFHVYFSQEARAYALLAFATALTMYLLLRALRASLSTSQCHSIGWWTAYSLAHAAALYTHYLALWTVVAQGLFVLCLWVRRKVTLRGWLLSQVGVGLLYTPWLLLMLGMGGLSSNAPPQTLGSATVDSPLASLIWIWKEGLAFRGSISLLGTLRQCLISFSVGDFIAPAWVALPLSAIFLILFAVGLWGVWQKGRMMASKRRESSIGPSSVPYLPLLLLHIFVPIVLSYLVSFPVTAPHWTKYFITAVPAYHVTLGTGLAELWKSKAWAGIAAALFAAGVSLFSLHGYYHNPGYTSDDLRPAVQYLETFSQESDALLANPAGAFPTFWYYYRGGLPYYSPSEGSIDEAKLEEIAATHSGLWVVINLPNDLDPDEAIEYWLTQHAYRTLTLWTGNVTFRYYSMPVSSEPVHHPLQVDFADQILLTDYDLAIRPTKYSHILQATLWWQALTEMEEQYLVSLRLLDQSGHPGGRKDIPPLGNFRPTVGWAKGERIEDHVGVFIWPGTPPGEYWVEVSLVNGSSGQPLAIVTNHESQNTKQNSDHILLGPVTIGKAHAPPPIEDLQFQHPVGVDLDGLSLLGYSLTSELIRPGDTLPFVLFWQAREKIERDYLISLKLQDEDGQAWGEHRSRPIEGAYPTNRWTEEEIVRDQWDWVVPPDVPSGRHRLLVGLIDEASSEQVAQADLGRLTVEARERTTTVPPIRYPLVMNLDHKVEFLGYDLQETSLGAGDTLNLTLYWRALAEMDTSYTVFTHLLDSDSRIWGQKDSVPGDGTLPTTSWLIGEVITDQYKIVAQPDAPPGQYVLEIGMYRAESGERLPILDDGRVVGDRILLKEITVR